MLPDSLSSSYAAYKADTSTFTQWLAKTGRVQGYKFSIRIPKAKGKSLRGKPTEVRMSNIDIVKCADFIATKIKSRKASDMPHHVAQAAQKAIDARRKFSRWYSQLSPRLSIETHDEANSKHEHFIITLELALATLSSCSKPVSKPGENSSARTPAAHFADTDKSRVQELANRFSMLQVEDLEDFKDPISTDSLSENAEPMINKAPPKKKHTSAKGDPLFAIFCCLDDMHALSDHVLTLWKQYEDGQVDLVTASLTTDAAYAMVSQLVLDLQNDHPDLDSWHAIYNAMQSPIDSPKPSTPEAPATDSIERLDWAFGDMAYILNEVIEEKKGRVDSKKSNKNPGPQCSFAEEESISSGSPTVVRDILDSRTCDKAEDHYNRAPERLQRRARMLDVLEGLVAGTAKSVRHFDHFCLQSIDHFGSRMITSFDDGVLPLDLVFEAQLFFDITQTLSRLDRPAARLRERLFAISESMDQHAKVKLSKREIQDEDLCENGCVTFCSHSKYKLYANVALGFGGLATLDMLEYFCIHSRSDASFEVHALLENNPVLCGLILLHFDAWYMALSLQIANTTAAPMSIAHLYNAVRVTGDLTDPWSDMEVAIGLLGESRVFVGAERPRDPSTFCSRFALSAGMSLKAFAGKKGGRRCEHGQSRPKDHWVGAVQRRRLLELDAPLASRFYSMTRMAVKASYLCSEVQDIINPVTTGKYRPNITTVEYSKKVTGAIREEGPKSTFDLLQLNECCEEIVDHLYDAMDKVDEVRASGALNAGPPNAGIVSVIFQAAHWRCGDCSKSGGNPKVLQIAGTVIREYLVTHGTRTLGRAARAEWRRRVLEPAV